MNKKLKASIGISNYCLIFIFFGLSVFLRPIFAAAGDLDLSFGINGIVSTPIPNEISASATDIVIQPDGKSVVSVLAIGQSGFDLAVVRYNLDGTLDTSFSGDGIFNTPFGSDTDILSDIALQPDGKILAVGSLISGQTGGFLVMRLNPDGSLDTSFDGDGIIVINTVLGSANGLAVAVQADGKIYAAGNAFNANGDFFSVIRLNSNGSLDTTFGDNGKAAVSFGFVDFLSDMKLQSDGKIVLMGDADLSSSNPYLALVRFNSNGTLDNTFDGDGRVTTQIAGLSGTALALQSDGRILVSGSLSGDFAVLRYNLNGSLDNSFDGDGIATASFGPGSDAAHDLIVQPDNKIIAVGETAAGSNLFDLDMAAVRFNPNGSLDSTFGINGKVVTKIGEGSDLANAVALQANGKIILAGAGTKLGSSQVTLVRYLNQNRTRFDFDGDGKADISVFRPVERVWYIQNSSNNSHNIQQFGLSDDQITPADYDGDGKTDIAVYRPSTGTWYWLNSSDSSFSVVKFGIAGDMPVPADFDGDGKADLVVFRPSEGVWYRLNSSNNQFSAVNFGLSEDKPIVGDYDGDGISDIAVWRPSSGVWYRLNSSDNSFAAFGFGLPEDKPTAADYDGDGKTDVAVFRPSTGVWYYLRSSNGSFNSIAFGLSEDKPTAADYDGDGKADIAVFRPSTGIWYFLRSTQGFSAQAFGINGDSPTPNAFTR